MPILNGGFRINPIIANNFTFLMLFPSKKTPRKGKANYKMLSLRTLFRVTVREKLETELISSTTSNRAQELCESRGGRPGLPVPNSPYGLCGREVTLNLNSNFQSSGTV